MEQIDKNILRSMAGWQNFLGIMMAIFTGLIFLFALICIVGGIIGSSSYYFDYSGGGIILGGFIYMLMGVLYLFFAIYLLRSAKAIKSWLATDNDAFLTQGLKNTKNYFQFNGILTIIGLSLAVLMILFGLMAFLLA